MFQAKWTVFVLFTVALLAACDKPDERAERPNAPTAGAPTAPTPTASAVASTAGVPTAASAATPKATATPVAPPAPPIVEAIKVRAPQGVEFVRQKDWRIQLDSDKKDRQFMIEPNLDVLANMNHASNAPILDIVVMHTAVLTTAENEVEILQRIQYDHIAERKWGDISAHYLIGPSGKVYQGRDIRYRSEASVGAGMGRFQDPWNKCAIMLLGNFNSPEQVFTAEARSALTTLIEDRKDVFGHKYQQALEAREAETRAQMGREGPFGLDEIRVRVNPSLPKGFLDSGGNNTAGDGGTGSP